jgi:hypothetical protein
VAGGFGEIQSGALSSEVTKAELDRIAALDPKLKSDAFDVKWLLLV